MGRHHVSCFVILLLVVVGIIAAPEALVFKKDVKGAKELEENQAFRIEGETCKMISLACTPTAGCANYTTYLTALAGRLSDYATDTAGQTCNKDWRTGVRKLVKDSTLKDEAMKTSTFLKPGDGKRLFLIGQGSCEADNAKVTDFQVYCSGASRRNLGTLFMFLVATLAMTLHQSVQSFTGKMQ